MGLSGVLLRVRLRLWVVGGRPQSWSAILITSCQGYILSTWFLIRMWTLITWPRYCSPGFFTVLTPLPHFPYRTLWKHIAKRSLVPFWRLLFGPHFQLFIWKRKFSGQGRSWSIMWTYNICPGTTTPGWSGLCLFRVLLFLALALWAWPPSLRTEISPSLGIVISRNLVKKWGSTCLEGRRRFRKQSR